MLGVLKRHVFIPVRVLATTLLPYIYQLRKWSFACKIILEFSQENSAILKVVPLLFVDWAPPWSIVILPKGCFTFPPVGVLLTGLFVADSQDFF